MRQDVMGYVRTRNPRKVSLVTSLGLVDAASRAFSQYDMDTKGACLGVKQELQDALSNTSLSVPTLLGVFQLFLDLRPVAIICSSFMPMSCWFFMAKSNGLVGTHVVVVGEGASLVGCPMSSVVSVLSALCYCISGG
jgi:hypothetical protein